MWLLHGVVREPWRNNLISVESNSETFGLPFVVSFPKMYFLIIDFYCFLQTCLFLIDTEGKSNWFAVTLNSFLKMG